jgi:hypothetical protein
MTEDETIHSFISGLQTEVKLQVELHRPNNLQTAKEVADRADTIIFEATRFSRGRGGPSSETASGNWPKQDDEAMKLGAARLRGRNTWRKKSASVADRMAIEPTSTTRMGHPPKLDSPGHDREGTKKFTEREQKRNIKTAKRNVHPQFILGTTHWKKRMVV